MARQRKINRAKVRGFLGLPHARMPMMTPKDIEAIVPPKPAPTTVDASTTSPRPSVKSRLHAREVHTTEGKVLPGTDEPPCDNEWCCQPEPKDE